MILAKHNVESMALLDLTVGHFSTTNIIMTDLIEAGCRSRRNGF